MLAFCQLDLRSTTRFALPVERSIDLASAEPVTGLTLLWFF
jgi:hypothetical protein